MDWEVESFLTAALKLGVVGKDGENPDPWPSQPRSFL